MSKRSRKDYSCKEKVELLDRNQQSPLTSQRDAAAQLSVERGFLRNLLRDQEKIRREAAGEPNERKRSELGKILKSKTRCSSGLNLPELAKLL